MKDELWIGWTLLVDGWISGDGMERARWRQGVPVEEVVFFVEFQSVLTSLKLVATPVRRTRNRIMQ